jgi:hypothetical protein
MAEANATDNRVRLQVSSDRWWDFKMLYLPITLSLSAVVGLAIWSDAQKTAQVEKAVLADTAIVTKVDGDMARRFAPLSTGGYLVSTDSDEALRPLLACLTGADGRMNTYLGRWDGAQLIKSEFRITEIPALKDRCAELENHA